MKHLNKTVCKIINTESIRFPQFYHNPKGDPEKPLAALYIIAQGEFNSLGLPAHFVMQRETGNGVVTVGTYVLTSSQKHNTVVPPEIDEN